MSALHSSIEDARPSRNAENRWKPAQSAACGTVRHSLVPVRDLSCHTCAPLCSESLECGVVTSRQAPSFVGLKPASAAASRLKRLNRSAETRHERVLRGALWRDGYRFRKNVRSLPGKPDIVFWREHVVVFCDGDFWHGRGWRDRSRKLRVGTNATYWLEKIRSNMRRDRRINRELARQGWRVIRIWENDILKDPVACAATIEAVLLRCR